MACRARVEYRINIRFYSYILELNADSNNCEEAMRLVSSAQFPPQLVNQAVKFPKIMIKETFKEGKESARSIIESITNRFRGIRIKRRKKKL